MKTTKNSKSTKQGEKYHNVSGQAKIKEVWRHLIVVVVTMTSALNQILFKMPKGERFAIWANENIQDLYGCQEET